MERMAFAIATALVASVVLAGCGNSDSNSAEGQTVATPTPTPEQSRAAGPARTVVTSFKAMRDTSSQVALVTLTSDGAVKGDLWQASARVDSTLWGKLVSDTFTLTQWNWLEQKPEELQNGRQYLMFLQPGGELPNPPYIISNIFYAIDSDEYVRVGDYNAMPARAARAVVAREVKG